MCAQELAEIYHSQKKPLTSKISGFQIGGPTRT
jgi:hypothetical protein